VQTLTVGLILDATSLGINDRTRSLFPLKVPGSLEARVLPAEARVPPKPLGFPEACVLPVEAVFLLSCMDPCEISQVQSQSTWTVSVQVPFLTACHVAGYGNTLCSSSSHTST